MQCLIYVIITLHNINYAMMMMIMTKTEVMMTLSVTIEFKYYEFINKMINQITIITILVTIY